MNEQELDEDQLNFGMKMAGSFGGGMCCGATCGITGGAVLTLSRWFGRNPGEPRNEDLTKYTKAFCNWFNERFESMNCCDLKADENAKAVCAEIMAETVDYVNKLLDEGLEEDKCSL